MKYGLRVGAFRIMSHTVYRIIDRLGCAGKKAEAHDENQKSLHMIYVSVYFKQATKIQIILFGCLFFLYFEC